MGRPPLGKRRKSDAVYAKRYRAKKSAQKKRAAALERHDERLVDLQRQADADSAAATATATLLAGITKRFAVIVADNPWRFGTRSPKGDKRKAPYGTLPTKEICRLIPPAAQNAGLFSWALPHMSQDAHEVIKEWGFGEQPKSKLYWMKKPPEPAEGERALGKGYWAREDQVEEFWICTRGNFVAPLPGTQFKQGWIAEARDRHSRKPDWFYEEIERLYPDEDKLEMFARPPFRSGWYVMGDEVPGGFMYVPREQRCHAVSGLGRP